MEITKIRDVFLTKIQERIEPVVKVADRSPAIVLSELNSLVLTPQWERYLRQTLEEYTEAFDQEDERGIGIWISGFFGSGKSLLMKILGLLLEAGEIQGQPVHDLFLNRFSPNSTEVADIKRYLALCQRKIATTLVGGNLHARQVQIDDPLALIVFKLFAEARTYTNNWAFAWTIEYQLDLREQTQAFRKRVCELGQADWTTIARDSDVYGEVLNEVVAHTLPELFSGPDAVEKAVNNAFQSGIDPTTLIGRLRRWCISRDQAGIRHKILLQLDELGQWIRGTNNVTAKLMQVQGLVETASRLGEGRIWMAVTAHGDIQELQPNVQQSLYATINQRFAVQCRLTNEDIDAVVQERLLCKTQTASNELDEKFLRRSGELTDLGSLKGARQVYPAPTEKNFAQYYPYLPWTITVIPKIVRGIAQSSGRDEALSGSNRTMITIVQMGILETTGLLDMPIGRIICLADLYGQLSSDIPTETKTDLNRVAVSVRDATEKDTTDVACALYLLGRDLNIPCTLDNIMRALVRSIDENLNELCTRVETELGRLTMAGYVKRVGDLYTFLSTQQRSFQSKIRQREARVYDEIYELSQKLKKFDDVDALRFDLVPVQGVSGGKNKPLRIQLDNRTIHNPTSPVTVSVYSPLQRLLAPNEMEDIALKLLSNQNPDSIIMRMGDVGNFRRVLARAVATAEVIGEAINKAGNDPEKKVAEQAQFDLQQYDDDVRNALAEAVRGSTIFFRGTIHSLMDGSGASNIIRNTLSGILSDIYPRFAELPHRLANDETAVKAALYEVTTNDDLQKLGVYTPDGTLNESCALLSTLKGKLPQKENDQGTVNADMLRSDLEKPPFGWDGQVVKVGLALLLRASACRLIIDGKPFTDPRSPEVLQYLTKDLYFKRLRVQGVRSELKGPELLAIRGYIQTIFNVTRLPAVASTLNDELGKHLEEVQRNEQNLHEWAKSASCPLPTTFETGCSHVAELRTTVSPSARLQLFASEWEALDQHIQLIEDLLRFKNEQGSMFIAIRTFYYTILDSQDLPSEASLFKDDWRTVTSARSVTSPAPWEGLVKAYRNAQQAMTNQVAQGRQEAECELTKVEEAFRERLLTAGVPDDRVDEAVVPLLTQIQDQRRQLEQPNLRTSDIRRVRNTLATIQMNLPTRVREISKSYQAQGSEVPQLQERRFTWQQVIGQVQISSQDDLEQVVAMLRKRIADELEGQTCIIIE